MSFKGETARVFGCSLEAVLPAVRAHKIGWVISAINEATMLETPAEIPSDQHLKLALNDIVEAREGLVAPSGQHIERLIDFIERWDLSSPLLAHCWAGVSRSTACVFIALCHLNPAVSEEKIARALREASPTATPNSLLVGLADDYLKRDGRMKDAVRSIGRGEMAYEGALFSLPAQFEGL